MEYNAFFSVFLSWVYYYNVKGNHVNVYMRIRVSSICVKTAWQYILKINFASLSIGYITHTTVSTTHYYPTTVTEVISLHKRFAGQCCFFPLGLHRLLLFSLLFFFPPKTVTLFRYLFSCYFLSEQRAYESIQL